MELDFVSLKALASSTRIDILKELMKGERTPTNVSKKLGKTKSTIVQHASILEDAGLLEKEEAEGRKRVVYRPTQKAEIITKGRKRQVRFALSLSIGLSFAAILILTNKVSPAQHATPESGARSVMADISRGGAMEVYEVPYVWIIISLFLLLSAGFLLFIFWIGYRLDH